MKAAGTGLNLTRATHVVHYDRWWKWGTLLDAVAARSGHVAVLLDGEMPANLVDDAGTADVRLLPRPSELGPECSCPDWGYPCRHAAALCYAIAARIDEDPFLLFALRGRTRDQIFAALRERRTADRPAGAPAPAGVPAAAAYARWNDDPLPLPDPPGAGPCPVGGTVRLRRSRPDGLRRLATDAATRAQRLLAGDHTSLTLTCRQDAVRLAADHASPEWFHGLQSGTGLRPRQLARLTRAWRYGGAPGAVVAEEDAVPAAGALACARTVLAGLLADMTGEDVTLRAWRGRLTLGDTGLQLRHGPDGRWYPYAREDSEWWPCAPADPDPVAALAAAWEKRPRGA